MLPCASYYHLDYLFLCVNRAKIIEVVPPSVGTDLHRERNDPDDNKKHKGAKNSLTVEEFMHDFILGVENNQDEISAGSGKELVKTWQDTFGQKYDQAAASYSRK